MFKIYDRYMLRQLMVSTMVVAGGLAMIVLLTQSIRLIELVLESNASSQSFFMLLGLSLPRFLEAVLPAAVLIATLFVFHRLTIDSEMMILRASGASPIRLIRPVLTTGALLVSGLLVLSLWVAPFGIYKMQVLRKEIRTQYAHLLFREGVFNTLGDNLTAYVRQRAQDGRLVGLLIHDTRDLARGGPAITVIARAGNLLNDDEGQKIIVYDGSRQERDPATGKFSRLDFNQYTLDIPATEETAVVRWQEPDERMLGELLHPKILQRQMATSMPLFRAELHRRFSTPLLMLSFALIGATCMVMGPFTRSGQMPLVSFAAVVSLGLQGVYLLAFSLAKKSLFGCMLLYGVAGLPVLLALFCLTPAGEHMLAQAGRVMRRILHRGGA